MAKRLLSLALVLFLAAAGAGFALRTPDSDPERMIAKYGGADARFAEGPSGMRVQNIKNRDPILLFAGNQR